MAATSMAGFAAAGWLMGQGSIHPAVVAVPLSSQLWWLVVLAMGLTASPVAVTNKEERKKKEKTSGEEGSRGDKAIGAVGGLSWNTCRT